MLSLTLKQSCSLGQELSLGRRLELAQLLSQSLASLREKVNPPGIGGGWTIFRFSRK